MKEIIFKPKHSIVIMLSASIIIPASIFVLFYMLFEGIDNWVVFITAIIFSSFIFLLPLMLFREIIFNDNVILFKRYLFNPKIVQYQNIKDIGVTVIKTNNGNIPISHIKNSVDLINILNKLIDKNIIDPNQLSGDLINSEAISFKALFISIPITIVTLLFLNELQILPDNLDMQIRFFIIWFIEFTIIYLFIKNKKKA